MHTTSDLAEPLHRLQSRNTLRLTGPLAVRVLRGTLWITIDGSVEDRVLEAGEDACLPAKPGIVAYALGGPSTFTVRPLTAPASAAGHWLRRLAQRWHLPRLPVLVR